MYHLQRISTFLPVLGLLLLLGQPANAQPQQVIIEPMGEIDGIELGAVTTILQDHLGYMWFGTSTGLYRYDGHRYTRFLHDPGDPTSLSGDWIDELYEDRSGTFWVGTTNAGLNRFERDTETFTRFVHDPTNPQSITDGQVRVVYEDREGTLWVGTGDGLNRFDRTRGIFEHFTHDPNEPTSLSDNDIRAVYEDHEGLLWIGTGQESSVGGLQRFDAASGTFVHYPGSLIDNRVQTIVEDPEGTVWVSTWGDGLHRYDRDRDAFTGYLLNPEDPNSLKTPYTGEYNRLNSGWGITTIHSPEDGSGVLWIGSSTKGLFQFDYRNQTFTRYTDDSEFSGALTDVFIWAITEDNSGLLWLGSWFGGLHKIDLGETAVQVYTHDASQQNSLSGQGISYIEEDDTGSIWIQTDVGTDRLDPETRVIESFPGNDLILDSLSKEAASQLETYLETYSISTQIKDRSGVRWIGTNGGGLMRVDPQSRTFTTYRHGQGDTLSLGSDHIAGLFEDSKNRIWIWSQEGELYQFDEERNAFRSFSLNMVAEIYSEVVFHAIEEDTEGNLWIRANVGFIRFNPDTETIDEFQSQIDGSAWGTNVYKPGQFLFGTWDSGLYFLDVITGEQTQFLDGLPVRSVYNIMVDDQQQIWVTSLGKIFRLDLEKGSFAPIPLPSTLKGHQFRDNTAFKSRAGDFYIITTHGLAVFSPNQLETNSMSPRVVLTGFEVSNMPPGSEGDSILKTSISTTSEVTLRHDQKDIAVSFSALAYDQPELNRFQYRLEPYDADWSVPGDYHSANYTNLPPDSYVFRVRAANANGVWNEEGTSLSITILPPWWRTWWAYSLYALIFLGGVFVVDRVQRRRLRKQERERAAKREQEIERENARRLKVAYDALEESMQNLTRTQAQLIQSEKMASLGQLTAGIAHEIKNPLNFVNNFAELNSEIVDEIQDELRENPDLRVTDIQDMLNDLERGARIINQHGKRADGIVQSMMDHASGGTGQRDLTDVNALVSEYIGLAYHGKRAQVPGFHCEIEREFGEDVGAVEMVPQEIGRVLLNLLSNAFDVVQGNDTPRVHVSTSKLDGQVQIKVGDNGPGIPEDNLEKIFEPFFTTKPTGSGTGLGLSLSYDIITQGHGGTLTVQSEPGKGAIFTINLPTEGVR